MKSTPSHRSPPSHAVPTATPPRRTADWFWPVAVALFVIATQGWFVAHLGSDVPWWDQWDAEGRTLYPRLVDGTSTWTDWLRPHNEHRIFWTHALNALLFTVNGQWDPLLQMTVGVFLRAGSASWLTWRLGGGRPWFAVAVAIAFLPHLAWHNVLWGFQSQVFFAVGFGLIALSLGSVERGFTRALGLAAAFAAAWAMAPGFLVPIAFAGVTLLRWREGRARYASLADLIVAASLFAVALLLRQSVPEHATLAAKSFGEFWRAAVIEAAWPHVNMPWAALVLNLPAVVLISRRLLRVETVPAAAANEWLGITLWAGLVAAAGAFARGGGGEFYRGVPSRYVDFTMLLPLMNGWALVQIVPLVPTRWQRVGRITVVAWSMFLLVGWLGLSAEAWRGIVVPRLRDPAAPTRLIQQFMASGDEEIYTGQRRLNTPHPNLANVRAVTTDARMQGRLPPSLQPNRPQGVWSRAVRSWFGASTFLLAALLPGTALLFFIATLRAGNRPALKKREASEGPNLNPD